MVRTRVAPTNFSVVVVLPEHRGSWQIRGTSWRIWGTLAMTFIVAIASPDVAFDESPTSLLL